MAFKFHAAALVLMASLTMGGQALAQQCYSSGYPSQSSNEPTQLFVYNDSNFDAAVYWSDFSGQLQWYATVAPYETASFDTFLYHNWYMEILDFESFCFGPIQLDEYAACDISVKQLNGIYLEYSGCTVYER